MCSLYRRHLPHQVPSEYPIFITWNLKGSISRELVEQLHQARERLDRENAHRPEETLRPPEEARHEKTPVRDQLMRLLAERDATAPCCLKDPEAARIVEDAILFGVH